MKKVIETIIKIILIILLFVSIFAFGILNILSNTVFNQEYTLKKLEETNYYANIYTQIKSDFRNYIYQSGLDENVIEDIVTPEEVKEDTRKIIVGIYNGLHEKVDTAKIKDRLNNNINKSLEDKKIDSKTQEAINTFVNQIADQYQETITKTEYENQIYKNFSKMQKIVNKGKKISIVLVVIWGVLIIITYYRKIFKNLAYLGTAFLSDGIAYVFLDVYISKKIDIENLTILNDAITITIREYLQSMLKNIYTYGYTLLIIGLVLIIFGNTIHGLKYYSKKRKSAH